MPRPLPPLAAKSSATSATTSAVGEKDLSLPSRNDGRNHEAAYRQWYRDRDHNDFALGAVQFVKVEPEVWVANTIGQHGLKRTGGKPPIRYEAIEAALVKVAEKAKELKASVHMARIGCGLAGGTWDKMESIIQRTVCDEGVTVFVYDIG